MNSFDIRQKFLNFFKKQNHTIVPSSPLIPAEDPTLLFVNAGMNQFKDMFLGVEKRSYTRATSSQKCVRAGGKHNDLDEVGFTNRHLTFFEMLGNFSFGDYFKKEAIEFAWQFLIKEIKLDSQNLVVSVYKTDDESYEIWHKTIGLEKERIFKLGEEDNFWQMGETGPCGPCSEIHFDKGSGVGCKTKHCDPSCPCGRFIEIWNLVFMQYDRQSDGTLKPLKQTGVDTGMGFERLSMILQKKDSIFESDLFEFLLNKIEKLTGKSYAKSNADAKVVFHVLADHVRSSSSIIADGGSPSNERRGYVLRKIIRRAVLFAQKLEDGDLFPKLAETFIDVMSSVFPNLKTNKDLILNVLRAEVEQFSVTLEQGQHKFFKYVKENKKTKQKIISGEQAFMLYDTYGFPPELTQVMARENGFEVDMRGFEKEMAKQKAQSGKKEKGGKELVSLPDSLETEFVGYDLLECTSEIIHVEKDGKFAWVVTKQSPFYVESGGQAGDHGWITIEEHAYPVKKLFKSGMGDRPAIAAQIVLEKDKESQVRVGAQAHCVVDNFKRVNSTKNHTATHLLQAALVQVLGPQVKQAGSQVNDQSFRFDFTFSKSLTKEQVEQVEQIVNQKIQENLELEIFCTTLHEAQNQGVTAAFGEKYNPECVRVVKIPGFSSELCGGTHVSRTGEIGCFKITSEVALASGTRRIVGVTGPKAVKLFQQSFATVKSLSELFKSKPEEVVASVAKQTEQLAGAIRQVKQMRKQLIQANVTMWAEQISLLGEIPFLFLSLDNYANDELKTVCTEIEKQKPGVYFLFSKDAQNEGRIRFVAYSSKKFSSVVDLKKLAAHLRETCQLSGGGSSQLVQGGGVD
ncbi:alanine--tRNA ligase, partial [Candidatus Babeliales bacterium]|nr:alanine--tRNA ligase [Candidatus Babeliales bacterium]